MTQETIRSLIRLGLSEKEAAVYAAALALGQGTAQHIATRANVSRATAYDTLAALERRGLITEQERRGTRMYLSETPQRFEALVEVERAELEGKRHVLAGTMPMLMALFNAEGPKPHVRYLEGEEGLETVRRMFLGLKGEFVQFLSYDDVLERRELHTGHQEHLRRLADVEARVLLAMKKPDAKAVPKLPHARVRLLPADILPMRGEITVRGSCVFLYAYRPRVLSVAVTSKDLADSMRALFELAWRGSEKIGEDVE